MTMHLTIAIATWNRADRLALTLDALRGVKLVEGVTCDAIVCDNNSSDHTRSMVEQQIEAWQSSHGDHFPLRYLFEPTQGKSHALNRLIRESDGEWILFIDDDIKVDSDWLVGYVEGMRRYPDAVCLGGPMAPWLDRPLREGSKRHYLLKQYPATFGILNFEEDHRMVAPNVTAYGGNMALRRQAIPKKGYDLNAGMIGGKRVAGEDVSMICQTMHKGEGWLLANAKAAHYVPINQIGFSGFWRWQKGVGARWVLSRGPVQPGRLGVPWWAWRRYLAKLAGAIIRWRPWPTESYYAAVAEAAQFYGYLKA